MSGVPYVPVRSGDAAVTFIPLYRKKKFWGLIPSCAASYSKISVFLSSSG